MSWLSDIFSGGPSWSPADIFIGPGATAAINAVAPNLNIPGQISTPTLLNTMTGGATNAFGITNDTGDLSQYIGYTNPLSPAEQGIGYIMQGGDIWTGLDRAVDLPGSRTRKDKFGNEIPQGDVDRGTREAGKLANEISGGASGQAMNVVAPIAGAAIAGIYGTPAAAPLGAAAGSAFASKWNQGSYEDAARRAAIAAATTYAAQGIGSGIDSLASTSATAPIAGSGYPTVGGLEGVQGLPVAQGAIQGSGYGSGLSSGFGNTGASVGSLGGGIESGKGFEDQIGEPTTPTAPGVTLAKQLGRGVSSTAIRAGANSLWPVARPQMMPQAEWAGSNPNLLAYDAALDPEMGRPTQRYGAQSNAMQQLSRRGADTGGSMGAYRLLKRLGVG